MDKPILSFKLTGRRALVIIVVYALWLTFIHSFVRDPLNNRYFQSYVHTQCVAELGADLGERPSKEQLFEIESSLSSCERKRAEIDGVWGGIFGRPSVRIKVTSEDSGDIEYSYYDVDVGFSGTPTVRRRSNALFYYLNL